MKRLGVCSARKCASGVGLGLQFLPSSIWKKIGLKVKLIQIANCKFHTRSSFLEQCGSSRAIVQLLCEHATVEQVLAAGQSRTTILTTRSD